MSFRVDLWNGLLVIKTQYNSMINKMSSLSEILVSYASYHKTYSKNLENLYKDNKNVIKGDYLLDKAMIKLINIFKSESEYHRQHYKYIKKNLIISIKEFIDKEKSLFNDLFNEGQQIQENYLKTKNDLINKQMKYNNSLKDFYNFISNFEENKLKFLIDNDYISKDTNPNKQTENFKEIKTMQTELQISIYEDNKISNQDMAKKDKMIEKINNYKNEYITTLNEANQYLRIYRNKSENILQSLEDKYKSLLKIIYSTLFSMVDDKRKLLDKLKLLFDNILDDGLNIDIENEIIEFISRNATKEFPINKFEFISNKFDNIKNYFDINKYLEENLGNEEKTNNDQKRGKSRKKTEIRIFRKRDMKKKNTGDKNENNLILFENYSIASDIKNYKIKLNISLIEDFIEELITNKGEEEINNLDNLYNDSSSKMIDISNIKSLIDKKNNDSFIYIENLIKFLNNNRSKGNFFINKKSYDAFIAIFNYLLDNYPNSDFILKNIIILAQTFYTFEVDNTEHLNLISKKKKIFIQDEIKNNIIFNKNEIWHRVINYNLAINTMNKDISVLVDKNEINNKLKIFAYNTLISYLCDLKYFTDEEKIFNDIKNFYVRIYQLDEEAINKEINGILNYEPSKPRKKGVSFSM